MIDMANFINRKKAAINGEKLIYTYIDICKSCKAILIFTQKHLFKIITRQQFGSVSTNVEDSGRVKKSPQY